MKLIFDSPWYVVLLCVALSLAFTLLLYFRNRKNADAPRPALYALLLLRFTGLFMITLLLAGILLRQVQNETEYPKIILAIDNSSSMLAGADSGFVKNELFAGLDRLKNAVEEKYEVHTLFFGSQTSHSVTGHSFSEKETDIDNLLKAVANNYANQNIGALLLVTDGIYNKGGNPAFSAATLGYPVYALALGDTSEKTDLLIRKVDHNQVAYLGNNFPVEVQVAAKKYRGRTATVELLQGGAVKAARQVKISSANFSEAVTFTLSASQPGIQRFTAKVSGQTEEQNALNNSQDFVVEVINNREKVLLHATAPHPDIAAIREAVANNTAYELELVFAGQPAKRTDAYNLVIIHGFSPASAALYDECRHKAIPFWIINPDGPEGLPGIRVTATHNRYNDAEPVVDETFGYFALSDELRAFVTDLPAVKTFFGNYALPPGSSPLLRQRLGSVETEQPMLYFNATEGAKYGVFLGEGLWRWKLRDQSAHGSTKLFAELVSKCIQYLSVKSDKSFFRLRAPKIVSENETIELDAELYNKSYEPVNGPDVFITLVNEQGQQFKYTFSKTAKAYHLSIGSLRPGEYGYRATVNLGGEKFSRDGRIAVKEMVAERLNTVANHFMLQQLAARSGGKVYSKAEIDRLTNELSQTGNMKAVVYSSTLTRPLIDQEWIFFLILAILGAEWFLRKRFLLI